MSKEVLEGWTNIRPEISEECILLTANWWRDHWEYNVFTIEKTEGLDDEEAPAWYWGIFEDGDEWGDYADLRANYYRTLKPLPQPPK